MPKQNRVTLEQVKEGNPTWDSDARVYIWSNEHRLYWRPDGCGYTGDIRDAGIYSFGDAFDRTSHCDPSKGIAFELVENGTSLLLELSTAAMEVWEAAGFLEHMNWMPEHEGKAERLMDALELLRAAIQTTKEKTDEP